MPLKWWTLPYSKGLQAIAFEVGRGGCSTIFWGRNKFDRNERFYDGYHCFFFTLINGVKKNTLSKLVTVPTLIQQKDIPQKIQLLFFLEHIQNHIIISKPISKQTIECTICPYIPKKIEGIHLHIVTIWSYTITIYHQKLPHWSEISTFFFRNKISEAWAAYSGMHIQSLWVGCAGRLIFSGVWTPKPWIIKVLSP